jgi:ribosomal protein L17
MRHRYKRTKRLETWAQKSSNVIRNLLTSLVMSWQIRVTTKRAKVLKAEADSFFSKLLNKFDRYEDEKEAKREIIRVVKSVIYTEEAWKKVVNEILPKYRKNYVENKVKTWFVMDNKLWFRAGDWAEEILLRLV